MRELDEVLQFLINSLSQNAGNGYGSLVTIKIVPYLKKDSKTGKKQPIAKLKPPLTHDDVLDAHEFLERYEGNLSPLATNSSSEPTTS